MLSALTDGMWSAVSSGLRPPTSWVLTAPPTSESPKLYGWIGVSSGKSCIPVRGAWIVASKRSAASTLSRT